MPIPDEERFEHYLKQFRPLAPEPLHAETPARTIRRPFVLAVWATAAAAVLIVAVLALYFRTGRPQAIEKVAGTEQLVNAQPLTIRSANALLASSSSFKAAVDEMAFEPKATPLSKEKHSALAVLSKEKTKL